MPTWEYKVEVLNISEKWSPKRQAAQVEKFEGSLNDLGRQGWELVNYQAVPLTGTGPSEHTKGPHRTRRWGHV